MLSHKLAPPNAKPSQGTKLECNLKEFPLSPRQLLPSFWVGIKPNTMESSLVAIRVLKESKVIYVTTQLKPILNDTKFRDQVD
jgi:hypothetical protein